MPGWWVDLTLVAVIVLAVIGSRALADLERMEDEEQ